MLATPLFIHELLKRNGNLHLLAVLGDGVPGSMSVPACCLANLPKGQDWQRLHGYTAQAWVGLLGFSRLEDLFHSLFHL